MTLKKTYGFIIAVAMTFSWSPLWSQNLVPNPSFEDLLVCPNAYGGICTGLALNWSCGNSATTDLFNACSSNVQWSVPSNAFGTETPVSGDGYAGMVCKFVTPNYREYVLAQLTTPLTAGTWYTVSFYISLGESSCGSNHIGAYLSATSPYLAQWTVLPETPQIDYAFGGYLSESDGWTLITGCFQAEGGEEYITIGNFHDDTETSYDPDCGSGLSYYFVDEVLVEEGNAPEELIFDLGGPEFACNEYVIDPGLSGYYYLWEDGSNGPTLTVNETGTYSLTISDGCNIGVDSIEVTIGGNNPPVDLGPSNIVLCDGDIYSISLDPDLFEYEWSDGSTGPDYSITTAGTYSVTLDDGCSASSDELVVNIMYPPLPFDLGDDGPLCPGEYLDYNFDPSLGDFTWQDGSHSNVYTIEDEGTYSLTISNMCGEETDEITVYALDVPDVQIGSDDVDLCPNEIYEVSVDPALGDILWPDGSNNPDFYISAPGFYTVFVTNECGTGSDAVNVVYHQPPAFDLGPDLNLCPGDTVILQVNGVDGEYTWQDQSMDTFFEVTQSGVYSLDVTNICGQMTDSVHVQYQAPLSPVDLGSDISLCPGESVVFHAGSPTASHLWNDMSTADSLLVNTAGTYFVTVSNACSVYADTIIVSVNGNPPQVDLPMSLSLCQGQSLTLDAMVTGVAYQWNDLSQNQQLTVISPGTYSVTVSNACGSDADTVVITDGGPAPSVDLGNDVSLCAGDTIQLSPVASNIDTWLWQDGSINNTYEITSPGLIYVTVQNTCGQAFDTLNATLLPAIPPLDLGGDTSLCSGQTFALTITIPSVNIVWPDGETDDSYTITGPGPVFASITNVCGVSSDTLQVTALPDVPVLNLGVDQSLCPGETITIAPGISDVTYLWQDGSTGTSYQTTMEETIILNITNTCGTSTDTLEIIENTLGPQLNLGNDIQACAGETVTIPSGLSGVNYLWQDGSTNPSFTTTSSGTFILEVSNNCGVDADTIVVDISGVAPFVDLGEDTTLCEGITIILISNADAITTTQWQDGSSGLSYPVTSPGEYSLMESNRCGDAGDTITVSYLDAPDPFTLGPDTTLCPGASITLQAPTQAYTILWQDGSGQPIYLVDQAGSYSLQLSNDCGTQSDEMQVDLDTLTPLLQLDPLITWCIGDIITLNALQPFPADYAWSTGATTATIEVTTPGVYSIDVIVPCSIVSQSVDVVADNDCDILEVHNDIYIPNVFSPNGDGINDLFAPAFDADLEILEVNGSIFDRWGNLVFLSRKNNFDWDGKFSGEELQPGVYVYILNCKFTQNGQEYSRVLKGDVTLIR